MRIAELFMTFPTSILSFFMVGVLGTRLTNVILAIALSPGPGAPEWCVTWWFPCASAEFIPRRPSQAAPAISGCSGDHLAADDPPRLLVLASLDIGHMMLHVLACRFSVSAAAPTRRNGGDDQRRPAVYLDQPLQMVWSGLALFISAMAFNLLGDALRDRLDPT